MIRGYKCHLFNPLRYSLLNNRITPAYLLWKQLTPTKTSSIQHKSNSDGNHGMGLTVAF